MSNWIFLIFEAHCNFHNALLNSVEAQCNSAIVEWHFCVKLKRNLPSATQISQHNANTFLAIIGQNKKVICKKRLTFIKITIEMEHN